MAFSLGTCEHLCVKGSVTVVISLQTQEHLAGHTMFSQCSLMHNQNQNNNSTFCR